MAAGTGAEMHGQGRPHGVGSRFAANQDFFASTEIADAIPFCWKNLLNQGPITQSSVPGR